MNVKGENEILDKKKRDLGKTGYEMLSFVFGNTEPVPLDHLNVIKSLINDPSNRKQEVIYWHRQFTVSNGTKG